MIFLPGTMARSALGSFMKNYFLISALFSCAVKSPSSPLISLPCGECARKIKQRQFRVPVQPGNPGGVLVDVLIAAGLSPSKGQARKDIEAGGVYLNNMRATDVKLVLGAEHLLFGKFVLLRKGKRNYALVRFEG